MRLPAIRLPGRGGGRRGRAAHRRRAALGQRQGGLGAIGERPLRGARAGQPGALLLAGAHLGPGGSRQRLERAAWFELGLLEADDWQGAWIAAERGISAPLLRTEFTLAAAPARARVYLSGLGYYELRINGAKVGRRVLDAASSYYHNDLDLELGARVLYASHDVTGHLRAGRNAIGAMLGNGWYAAEADVPPSPRHRQPYGARPQLLLQLQVELTEGEPLRLASGAGWRASAGPVRYNDYSHGESYDARLEQPGWDTPGYDDSGWSAAQEVAAPSGALRAQPLPASEVVETRAAQRVLRPRDGVAVFDFGQNFSGWSRLRVQGSAARGWC